MSMDNATENRILETASAFFEIKEGILYGKYKKGVALTLELVKELVTRRLEFAENIPYPVIVNIDGLKSVNKAARDYLANEGTKGIIAGALVTKSAYGAFIRNFFLRLTKPPFPSRMFKDTTEAQKWIEQYKFNVPEPKTTPEQ
ncbi:MAG: STAS/SEC14 domain-containing protein [Bacteroidia bacterium]